MYEDKNYESIMSDMLAELEMMLLWMKGHLHTMRVQRLQSS